MRSFLEDFETDDEEEEILRPEIMEQLDEEQIEEVKERGWKIPLNILTKLKKQFLSLSQKISRSSNKLRKTSFVNLKSKAIFKAYYFLDFLQILL